MTDEEILIAGESLLKTAKAAADADATDLDIIFTGEDLKLWIRYQEVKRAAQATPGGRKMLKAALNQAEIKRIYAKDYGALLNYVSAWTAAWGSVHTVGTHVHYDTNTNNAVYCANINRHFVDSDILNLIIAGESSPNRMFILDMREQVTIQITGVCGRKRPFCNQGPGRRGMYNIITSHRVVS